MFWSKKRKGLYRNAVSILAEQGYSDEYTKALNSALADAKTPAEIAEGKSYIAAAYLYRGELDKACEAFSEVDRKKLPELLRQSFAANRMLCLFLKNKFREAEEVYESFNRELLEDGGVLMRRSLGIHQFILNNYDAALTVFIMAEKEEKKSGSTVRTGLMLDICIVRSLMKLDMYDKAADYSAGFARYENLSQLGELCKKMKKDIFDRLNGRQRVRMVKNKRKNK